jgi:hypothetical protein
MFEKGFLPIILVIISAAMGALLKDGLTPGAPAWKKRSAYGLIILSFVSLLVWATWSSVPNSPADLSGTATALVATSTKISAQIEGTTTAGTATAIAIATQLVAGKNELVQQMTATQSAKLTNISRKVSDNAGLCNYAANNAAFENQIDSYTILSLIGLLFWVSVVVFIAFAIRETQKRRIFVPLLAAFLVVAVFLTISIASHPFFNLPDGMTTVSDEGYRQAILQECENYRLIPVRSTQTHFAAQTQAQAPFSTQTELANRLQSEDATVQAAAASLATQQTATQQAFETWIEAHTFVDEFSLDKHGWTGEDQTSEVSLDRNQGLLIYSSNKDSRISFWKCDLCAIPTDHKNYSFEFKYSAPEYPSEFNFGFLFGCTRFDEDLVDCQAVYIKEKKSIILHHIGKNKTYDEVDHEIKPNAKGNVSIVILVRDRHLSLQVNDEVVHEVQIDGDAGGMFGLYSDPPGYTVFIDRMEIKPLQ